MNPLSMVGLGIGLVGGIGQMIGRHHANKELGRLMGQDPQYQTNPLAQERLGLARTLLNARMPGASQVERNLYQNQANAVGNITKNATDSSQLLALGSGAQGNTNEALNQLGLDETQDYQRRLGNLTGAQEGMINEGDKVFQDKVRRFGDTAQIKGAQQQNRMDNWQTLSNMGMGLADFGMNGGFSGLFGKKSADPSYNVAQPNVDAQLYQLWHTTPINPIR